MCEIIIEEGMNVMPAASDLVGKQFHHFKVIKKIGKDKFGNLEWLCECQCGNQFTSFSHTIKSGDRKSCGCKRYDITRRRRRIKDPKDISYKKCITKTIQLAKRRGIKYQLDYDEALALIKSSCHYCGSEPFTETNAYLTKTTDYCGVRHKEYANECWIKTNGIDRIDSDGNYTTDNVVACCQICNMAKSTMTVEEFFQWVKRVYDKNCLHK